MPSLKSCRAPLTLKLRASAAYQTYESNLEHNSYVYYNETIKACRETCYEYSCSGYIASSEP